MFTICRDKTIISNQTRLEIKRARKTASIAEKIFAGPDKKEKPVYQYDHYDICGNHSKIIEFSIDFIENRRFNKIEYDQTSGLTRFKSKILFILTYIPLWDFFLLANMVKLQNILVIDLKPDVTESDYFYLAQDNDVIRGIK